MSEKFDFSQRVSTIDVKWDGIPDSPNEVRIKEKVRDYVLLQMKSGLEGDDLQRLFNNLKTLLEIQDIEKLNLEKNKLNLIVSGEKNKNMSYFNQDAYFLLGEFTENKKEVYKLKNKNNGVYIFVIEGKIEINGNSLRTEDSSTITEVEEITMQIDKNSKILLIEVPQ